MVSGLILGVLLAIGHHLFYHSLDKKIVHSNEEQQWYLRVGTGFAFAIKSLLVASATLAYSQVLWITLDGCSTGITLSGLDSFGVTYGAWHFVNGELWKRGPALAVIALVIWYGSFT
jgi:hypothetical protein